MLDIESLRLPYVQKAEANDLIDAQLAKALWGIVDIYEEDFMYGDNMGALLETLREALEQANIERPTEAKER